MISSGALRPAIGALSLALLGACNADRTLTPPVAVAPIDSLTPPVDPPAVKFPPLVGQIAFTSTRDGSSFIYVAAADGSSLRRLAKGEYPSWSWDGRQIVFQGVDYAGDSSIHVINADGSGERVLQLGGVRPDVSADGSRIAYSTDAGMYVANRDGSNPTLLVRSEWQRPGDRVDDAGWSPDGNHIAFFSGEWDAFGFGIYVANVDGSVVLGTVLPGSAPRWSPDGSMMAFGTIVFTYVAGTGPHNHSSHSVLAVAKPDGSDMRVVNTGTLVASTFDWSPDGRSLLLSPGHRIFVTDPTFRATRQLIPDAVPPTPQPYDDFEAVWSRVVKP